MMKTRPIKYVKLPKVHMLIAILYDLVRYLKIDMVGEIAREHDKKKFCKVAICPKPQEGTRSPNEDNPCLDQIHSANDFIAFCFLMTAASRLFLHQ